MNSIITNTELSSPEGTRSKFNPGTAVIKLGIDVHQEFYVVVVQEGGSNPKPAQRFRKEAFLSWAAKLRQKNGAPMHAVYEACGFGFGLQRALTGLGIKCYVVCPQKLDEQNKRVKTDGEDAKALSHAGFGISSYVRPPRRRPVRSLRTPPHCLKKKGVFCLLPARNTSRTHSIFIGRACGPDSPPTITQ